MTNKQKVVFINGPKRSGKDSLGHLLQEETDLTCSIDKAAHPLYNAIQELFGLSPDEWEDMYENAKEKPHRALEWMSPREAMIWLSETVVKPTFDSSFFGKSLARRILSKEDVPFHIITDAGFTDEIEVCVNMLPINQYDVYMIRLCREGTSFEGDSRHYIDPSLAGIPHDHFDIIPNKGSLEDLRTQANRWLKENT